jgi:CHASE domain-containing protein
MPDRPPERLDVLRTLGRKIASRQHRKWRAIAVLIFVVGTIGSAFAGVAVARTSSQKSHETFARSSSEVASTLQLSIQHEQDLIVSARGFVAGDPTASNAQFAEWAKSVNALGRYPELVGIGHSIIVPAAALPAFAARAVTDPAGPLTANGTFEVVPAGNRPFYCLAVGALSRNVQTAFPAGTDFCATGPSGAAALVSRDSGVGTYLPIASANSTLLSIKVPVYRGGTVPASEVLRRAAFIGWVGMAVVPEVLLSRALASHR